MVECTGNAAYNAAKGKPKFLRKFHVSKVLKAIGATKGKGVMPSPQSFEAHKITFFGVETDFSEIVTWKISIKALWRRRFGL